MRKSLPLVMSTALTLSLLMGCSGGANAGTAGQTAGESGTTQAAEESGASQSVEESATAQETGESESAEETEESGGVKPAGESQNAKEAEAAPEGGLLNEESALKFLEDHFGKEDADTGNTYSFGYMGDAEVESEKYLVFDWRWLVDGDHLSRLDTLFVSADGSGVYSGIYDESGGSIVYKETNLLEDNGRSSSGGEEGGQGESAASLPAFSFADDEPYMNAILDYMNENAASHYDKSDVMIPLFQVLRTDDSNKDEVKVWGDFWVMNYRLEDKNLAFESGGSYPGMFTLIKDGDAYKASSFDQIEDGSDYGPSSERIFGIDKELMDAFNNRDKDSEEIRKKTIREYADKNSLDIESYQDQGWDKVEI